MVHDNTPAALHNDLRAIGRLKLCAPSDIVSCRRPISTITDLVAAFDQDPPLSLARGYFHVAQSLSWSRSVRSWIKTLARIELDHFKHVNDSLGHAAGDNLLISMAERLIGSVRACDFVSRIGGDEFAVILEPIEGEPDTLTLGDQVLTTLLPPTRIAGRLVRPGASIGGAIFPEHATSAGDLFNAADTALYALKNEGRGGTKLFNPQMLPDARRAASQLDVARAAVVAQNISAYYQPKVDLATGAIVGFEALLRCRHRTTLQLPQAMEEAFKDYELAAKLGELMQQQVANDLSSWLRAGFDVGTVSINASPAEFLRGDYAQRLLKALQLYDVPPSSIEVEPHGIARCTSAKAISSARRSAGKR